MSFAETIYPSSENTSIPVITPTASNEKTRPSPIVKISKKIDFLLCNSCFWCVSYLNLRRSFGVTEGPSCNENTIERMPLYANEIYLFDYNRVTGVILEFSNYNKGSIVSSK